ncbi:MULTISPECIES: class II aldolase/adducin family protein [unclassified Adlercreutzia]|uniref:class II aldolase/adducin family protein n=1 Tax=unclassified Adlercreutzia TaxID=2636013 RepID=UPI0013EAB5B2|nr:MULTISPECIES: class II aldolase/adducin family protein [unclassified Adlercreutzia]
MDDATRAAFEALPFVRGMMRMCGDGWDQGWHERNGGNASYRLTAGEAERVRTLLVGEPGAWAPLGVEVPELAGALFLVTATGSFMRNVADDPSRALGIVEVDGAGGAWRALCGFSGGGRPTSEFAGHLLIHAARLQAHGAGKRGTPAANADGMAVAAAGAGDAGAGVAAVGERGADVASGGRADEPRVLYHAHPVPVIALAKVLPPDARVLTRALWRAMTECVMVFPEGVGCVGLKVPGSLELARSSAEQARRHAAVIWAHHGLLSTGATFDDAFGRMHAIVKAAEIHNTARMMTGEGATFAYDLTDEDLRALARGLNVTLNEDFISS